MANEDEIDDLDAIEAGGKANEEVTLSNVYSIKVGGFGENNLITTYLASVKVKDLKEDIDFFENLTKDKSWPVSQIIQREVNKSRVSNIAREYVLGPGREVKYFPPIIIAILPKDKDGKISLKLNFEPDNSEKNKGLIFERSKYRTNEKLKKYFLRSENKSLIHGLNLLEISEVFEFNLLSWDKCEYYAIVIDGQHRLDSLFSSMKSNPDVGNFHQDIAFLDVSRLIASSDNPVPQSPVEVVRRIFVDINTNAQKVGVVRQILMDDKDLPSLLVQSMVDAVWRDGSEKSSDYFIPSQIVDWYGESLKHQLPHITGILALHQIIEDNLVQYTLGSIKELRSEKKIFDWVKRLNEVFLVDEKIKTLAKYEHVDTLEKSLKAYNRRKEQSYYTYDDEEDVRETEIFVYDYGVLEVAQETFQEIFLRPLVSIFSKFKPYSEVIDIIKDSGGFDTDKILSHALISSRTRIAASAIYQETLRDLRTEIEEKLLSKYYLIYSVLGQKTVFSILFQRLNQNYVKGFDEERCQEITNSYIGEVNDLLELLSYSDKDLFGPKGNASIAEVPETLVDLGTIASSFWEGIIYDNGSIIYNTQGIRSLSAVFNYLLSRFEELIEHGTQHLPAVPFNISYLPARIRRNLKRNYGTVLTDDQIEEYVEDIVANKKQFLEEILISGFKQWNA